VNVEPLEFTSSGGRRGALSRIVKSRFLTFYEVIIIEAVRLMDLPVNRTRGFFKADKPLADTGAIIVDGTLPLRQKFTAVFDNQLMAPNERKVKAGGAMGLEDFILLPGDFQSREGSAALPVASPAKGLVFHRMVQKEALPFYSTAHS
jgi:hypothetical protein